MLCVFIDYDYDYYGYGDYRGGYSDPYYDDFYRYEDYYYDYAPPPPPARGRGRQPQPVGRVPLFSYVCTFDCGTVFLPLQTLTKCAFITKAFLSKLFC